MINKLLSNFPFFYERITIINDCPAMKKKNWKVWQYCLFLNLAGLIACNQSYLEEGNQGQYFRFDSLMRSQYELLIKEASLLERTIQVDSKLNNYNYIPSEKEWAEELNVLFEIDPNSDEYESLFTIQENKYRLGKEVIHQLPDSIDLPLKRFRYTQFNNGEIEEISALIHTFEDSLNYNEKFVFIEFWKGRLDKFQIIEGKMVKGDTSHYVSTGLIGFKDGR